MGSFKYDNRGLKDFMKKLDKAAERVSGEISFEVLFNNSFMTRYTNFSSFSDLLDAGGYEVNSQEDFEAIPDEEFNSHIRNTTKFNTWKEMLTKASNEYVEKSFKL